MKRALVLLALMGFVSTIRANFVQQYQVGVEKGLSCNAVRSFTKDIYGRMWVGTVNGANLISNGSVRQYRYFTVNGNDIVTGNTMSIGCYKHAIIATNSHILDFDPENDSTRIVTYNGNTIRTEYIMMQGDTAIFYNAPLSSLMRYITLTGQTEKIAEFPAENQLHFSKLLQSQNNRNQIILAENDRGIYTFDLKTGTLTHIGEIGGNINSRASFIDSKDILWIATTGKGVSGYYIGSGFDLISKFDTGNSGILSDNISCMEEMPDGNLLICSDNHRLIILNRKNGTVADASFGYDIPLHVTCAMVNRQDNEIILGTLHKGIVSLKSSFFHSLSNYQAENNQDSEVATIPVSAFQDNDGTIWFGTGGFGVESFNEKTGKYTLFNSTQGMRIFSICNFDRDNLLITDRISGLFLFNKKTGTLKPTQFLADAGIMISAARLTHLKTISTPDGDIMLFNCSGRHLIYRQKTGQVNEIFLQQMNGQENNGVVEDVVVRPSHATIACNGCIYQIDYRTLLARLIYQDNGDGHHNISHVAEDSRGTIWACSPDELISFDPRENKISNVLGKQENEVFLSMNIDNQDQLWITTDKSMIIMYDTKDAVRKEPYYYSGWSSGTILNFLTDFSMVSKEGIVYFPHTSGILVIDPNDVNIKKSSGPLDIMITKTVLDGKTIDNSQATNKDKVLTLPNRFSLLDVNVAVNQFNPTRMVPLKYTLLKKGRPDPILERVTASTGISIPKSTYGSFTLQISQRTVQGWTEPQDILSFNVAKPFIMTIPAYLLIIAIIISISVTISKVGISLKQIDMDRTINAQQNKYKDEKISLLSNLAHELRTPLSLIYNPVKDMLEENTVKGADYDRLLKVSNQIRKMTEMVNLILDKGTRDITRNDLAIEPVRLNLWLENIIREFMPETKDKGLKLEFMPSDKLETVFLDRKVVEIAVTNIITNAIKFSDTGTITISTGLQDNNISISVHDEGRGFSCKPEELFKRYNTEHEFVPGYGMGLSYSRFLIELLEGTITASRNDGPGSTFTIEIPADLAEKNLRKTSRPHVPLTEDNETVNDIQVDQTVPDEFDFDTKSMTLLIVDDQDDILQFIKNEYAPLFKTIYTAHDGKEGLDIIRQHIPNVVVSDIMMPRMNGFELCRTIKTDLELSSIPVILLTSRSDPKNQDMGYKMGADSFLPKPFDSKLLYKIIRSQLKNRFDIKRQYASSFITAISEEQTFSAADEQFVLKLNRFIKDNLANSMLGVDMIVEHMGVSRTTLFNKMNALVGVSTNKYIRRIRIEVAKEMLAKTTKPVGTIADETGFSESQYFSTVFKQETGMTPSQYKESLEQ
ncbi:MAG: response regulator [Bacteroidaceae bacterium]|nr:response regulator [Bacteroidaceae bacterium]